MAYIDTEPSNVRNPGASLQALHQQLSKALDEVQERLMFETRPGERICLAVIEDDLVLLVEECEDYLMGSITPGRELWRSLLSRAACVVEELDGIDPIPRKRTHSRRKNHPRLHSRASAPILTRNS